ncbi:YciI family protein [Pseudoxanthomonas sp. SL93]|uniref:YciI family protein n=1 Tax=Pseudoxanthomonas sp. SL93 TaxID=2995142 RepID=UPI00227138AB|nr:YciI family protein [Pseudoxanthomonas sp. SL93]WAC64907.1 YciI family protein [Pseudoxanthomonas sp. SL93]
MRTARFEESVIAPHLEFLQQLREAGQLEMTGGFSDKSGGAYVLINVASLAEAQAIAARDPLAITGTSELTVHEWNTR